MSDQTVALTDLKDEICTEERGQKSGVRSMFTTSETIAEKGGEE